MAATVELIPGQNFATAKVTEVRWTWTSTSGGAVSSTTAQRFSGILVGVMTIPDATTAPSNLYDVQLKNDDGMDLLGGSGADRSSTSAEFVKPVFQGVAMGVPINNSKLDLEITNAGNAKVGKTVAYIILW